MIVDFFRRSQPFASLGRGGDAKVTRLSYMHDIHLQAIARALKDGHFRLGLVTALITLSKTTVVFSAGIISMVTAPSPHRLANHIRHTWRSNTLANNSGVPFPTETLRDKALSASFSGPLWRSIQNEGTCWYLQLLLTQPTTSSYRVNALKANMTCAPIGIKPIPNKSFSVGVGRTLLWNILLTDGECAGQNFIFPCADLNPYMNRTNTADALCTLFSLRTHTDCPVIPEDNVDRWLVMAVSTLDGPEKPQNLSVGESSQISAIMCTPQGFLDELEDTVLQDANKKL